MYIRNQKKLSMAHTTNPETQKHLYLGIYMLSEKPKELENTDPKATILTSQKQNKTKQTARRKQKKR